MIEPVSDHVAQGIARLLEQYKRSTRFIALLTVYLERTQALEDALWEVLELRSIDTGFGIILDHIGKILNEPRGGLIDDDYRILLRAKVKVLKSSGTGNQLIEIGDLSIPGGYTFTLADMGNATLLVTIVEPVAFTPGVFQRNLLHAKSGGVKLIFEFSTASAAETFRWTDGPGWGSVYDPGAGGYLASWISQ